jgi:diguanylate cyclase (GGDEF)-like protein/PAS domain S-box-containing protein
MSDNLFQENGSFSNNQTFNLELYRTLVEHMLNGVACCKMLYQDGEPYDFIYLYTNPAFEQLTGLKDVAGKPVSQVIPGIRDSDSNLFEIYNHVAQGGKPEQFETYVESLKMWFSISVYSPKPEYFVAIFDVITERKQTEQALALATEMWSLAQSAANAGSWYWDIQKNRYYWSDELYALFGLHPQIKPAGFETWLALLHEDDRQQAEQHTLQSISDKLPLNNEYRIITPAGKLRWIRALGNTAYDQQGVAIRMSGICFDITQSKLAEMALRESEECLRIAQASAKIGIWSWQLSTDKITWTTELERIFGYTPGSFPGTYQAFCGHIHSDDLSPLKTQFNAAIAQQQCFDLDFRILDHSKTIRWVNCKGAASYGNNGQPERIFGVIMDITERKQAEEQLRIAATAFESQEGMFICDANKVILRVNKAFSEITGYSSAEVIGQNPCIFQSGLQDKEFYAAMWKSINDNDAWEGEIWNRRKNGEIYPQYLTITAVKSIENVVTHYVATLNDITQKKAAEEEINMLAFYDPLTKLPNRRLLQDRLKSALASSNHTGRHGAVLFIDLDNFKSLNDSLGHDIGDELLKQVAHRLEKCLRECDSVARLGGDEFMVLLEDLSEHIFEAATQVEVIGHKILNVLNQSYQLFRHEYLSTASIGVVLFNGQEQSLDDLPKRADIAMYQAKTSGRNTLRFFDPEMQNAINARAKMELGLRKALGNQEFQLYYQLQVDSSLHPLGAEALIRWLHPSRGVVSPAEFIPLAEETGLIVPIGQWVIESACAQLKTWQQHPLTRELVLSVNVSAKQFFQVDFVAQLLETVKLHEINPNLLKLELTESIMVENIESTISTMNTLRASGIQFSLDDFGTGYSSLQYLKKLPLDQLKIDRSFIRDFATDSGDQAIVCTIIAMANTLKLDVIAEGVETQAQRQLLLDIGCTNFQGYLFSKPVTIDEFESLIQVKNSKTQ